MHLFSIVGDEGKSYLEVEAIHNDAGYKSIREALAKQYNLREREPNIQVYDVDISGSRRLTLRHYQHERRPLDNNTSKLLRYVHKLWQFDIALESVHNGHVFQCYYCPEPNNTKGRPN